jgi:hypothetical protein
MNKRFNTAHLRVRRQRRISFMEMAAKEPRAPMPRQAESLASHDYKPRQSEQ